MKRAFWDLIKSDLEASPQRFDHILKLIGEIGDRFCAMTPSRSDIHKHIRSVLDEAHLRQMFTHGAFDMDELGKVCIFIMDKLEAYSAPADTSDIQEWSSAQQSRLHGDIVYAEWLPGFIEGVHSWLDLIQQRMTTFYKKQTV